MDHLFKGILIPLNNFSLSFNERIKRSLEVFIFPKMKSQPHFNKK